MQTIEPKIEEGWKQILKDEFQKQYFFELKDFLQKEKAAGQIIYPAGNLIFSAFDFAPFDKFKVVIIGQDPYHGEGQANGLCFSVSTGVRTPPSLVNIFKEIKEDLNIHIPNHGNLEKWAKQGVLLLNATLTVRANTAGSHQKKGWENFTDAVIKSVSDNKQGIIFLLWGKFAQAKEVLIDTTKHHVLKAAHPSPLAGGAFFGCKHFSKTNELLKQKGMEPIDWDLN